MPLQASKKDLAQEYQGTCTWSTTTRLLKKKSGQWVFKTSMIKVLKKSEGSIQKIIIGTRCDLAIEKGKGHLPTRIRAGFSQIF